MESVSCDCDLSDSAKREIPFFSERNYEIYSTLALTCKLVQNIFGETFILTLSSLPNTHGSWWRRLSSSFVFLQKKSSGVFIKTNIFALVIRLQKTSSRCLEQSNIRLGYTFSRRLQDVFKTSSKPLQGVSRCLLDILKRSCWDVFKTSSKRLQEVLQKRLQDIFKTSCKDVFKTFSSRIIKLNCSC